MSLGIFKCLWDLLENGMKELDLKVACQVAGDGQGTTFDKYCFDLRRQAELRQSLDDMKQKKIEMEQLVTLLSLMENVQGPLSAARTEVQTFQQAILSTVNVT